MNEFIEKLITILDEEFECYPMVGISERIRQLAEEHNGGWIPCEKELPKESGEYLTFVNYDDDEFVAIDEFDCEGIMTKWNCTPNYHVIAWQPLPDPYQQKEGAE